MKETLTKEALEYLFRLDTVTGKLYWKVNLNIRNCIGKEAGVLNRKGYRQVGINRKIYLVHRVIWTMLTGDWPVNQLDHINGIRDDNRPENLREATRSQNQCNRGTPNNSSSGKKGVHWYKETGKWQVRINIQKKRIFVGYFDTFDAACKAYDIAAEIYHGAYRKVYE